MWPFSKRIRARPITNPDVIEALTLAVQRISALENDVKRLDEEVKVNLLHHQKLRGRVYEALGAEKGSGGGDLSDPRLTKAEIRARLHGRAYKHQN